MPQAIENAKTFTPQALYNWKRNEKEIIKGYIRDWSYISTLIEHEWKLDELNKNVQGLKVEFDILKNQVNDLDRRVQNLENRSNWNCANIVAFVGGASSPMPMVGTFVSSIATMASSTCAIAGV